jgi:hypothetical protein
MSVYLNSDLTWFERISMLVILLNCVTLGMYRPCLDDNGCDSNRCKILQVSLHYITLCNKEALELMPVSTTRVSFWYLKS